MKKSMFPRFEGLKFPYLLHSLSVSPTCACAHSVRSGFLSWPGHVRLLFSGSRARAIERDLAEVTS